MSAAPPDAPRRRGRGILRVFLFLAILAALAWAGVALFGLGLRHGLMAGGGLVVVYMVPATILDWPRPTLSDLVDALAGLVALVVGVVAALLAMIVED